MSNDIPRDQYSPETMTYNATNLNATPMRQESGHSKTSNLNITESAQMHQGSIPNETNGSCMVVDNRSSVGAHSVESPPVSGAVEEAGVAEAASEDAYSEDDDFS